MTSYSFRPSSPPKQSYFCSALSRDPDHYTSPDSFIPERFLGPDGKIIPEAENHVLSFAFGFGRRYVLQLFSRNMSQ